MNKSYRLLWSDITRTRVAVSEVVKASGKRASAGIFEGIVKPGHYIAALCPYPIRQTNSVALIFPIPHRPTKLLIEPAACKSLKILEVASRALASLLITERGICGNRGGKRAAAEATLATSLRFSLGERAKKSQPIRVRTLSSGGGKRNRTRIRTPNS